MQEENKNTTDTKFHKTAVMRSFNEGKEFDLEVYSEICCDYCNEVIHNHIDCPVCEKKYAGTEQYCDLYDEKELQCENCGTKFEKISDSWYYDCKAKITELGKNYA